MGCGDEIGYRVHGVSEYGSRGKKKTTGLLPAGIAGNQRLKSYWNCPDQPPAAQPLLSSQADSVLFSLIPQPCSGRSSCACARLCSVAANASIHPLAPRSASPGLSLLTLLFGFSTRREQRGQEARTEADDFPSTFFRTRSRIRNRRSLCLPLCSVDVERQSRIQILSLHPLNPLGAETSISPISPVNAPTALDTLQRYAPASTNSIGWQQKAPDPTVLSIDIEITRGRRHLGETLAGRRSRLHCGTTPFGRRERPSPPLLRL